jgi:hypothetical protein
MRFWPIRGSDGALVPDAYLMSMDYAGVNYDYNDDVYVIRNIRPVNGSSGSACALPCRLDVGRSSGVTVDHNGNAWKPDLGYFAPGCAPDEPGNLPTDVQGTADDALFDTYRGNAACQPPNTRTVTWTVPLSHPSPTVDLNLLFAERYSGNNAAGKRVFSITVNGVVVKSAFDIYAAAGGANRAYVLSVPNVSVPVGTLTIALHATHDNASLAGIEVLGQGTDEPPPTDPGGGVTPPPAGGGGTTPPAAGGTAATPATGAAAAPASPPAEPLTALATPLACTLRSRSIPTWGRGLARLRFAASAPTGAVLALRTAAGRGLASGGLSAGGFLVGVDTRKLPQGLVPLRATVTGTGVTPCSLTLRLRVDNRAPTAVKLRHGRRGALRTVSFIPSEPISLRLTAPGKKARTLRAPGGHRLTVTLPAGAKKASLTLTDRAGNHAVKALSITW